MGQSIYKYIQTHFSQQPKLVDRLIVSAFFRKNGIRSVENDFINEYLIKDDELEESQQFEEFLHVIDKYFDRISIETLIELFEFVISPSDRIVTGAVYTPNHIREFIISSILSGSTFIEEDWLASDIACGCGGFLYTLAKHLKAKTLLPYKEIFKKHLFGLDIKLYSVTRTKVLLTILAIEEGEDEKKFDFNLFVGDALCFDWKLHIQAFKGFNCVVGNPPYVSSRKIEEQTKRYLSNYEVCMSGHPDLYIPFFQIGLELLAVNGFLGYITMNTFFKSLNARALRQFFQEKSYDFKLIDFGTLQVFKKRSTYTCICLINNTLSENLFYSKVDDLSDLQVSRISFTSIAYSKLKPHNGWNLRASDVVNKIEAVGVPFSKKYKTRNGIATLKNEIFIFKPVFQDRDHYFLQNGNLYPIEKAICKSIINPNFLTSQTSVSSIAEKFIFPYEFIDGKPHLLSEVRMENDFPCTYNYLKEKKLILATRDKGKGKYPAWFAFGRTQSLDLMKYKLFFPHITPHTPNYIINTNENLFFYNGIAVIGKNKKELEILKKLMSSRLFWFYLKSTSKPYTSGYFSMSKNYIKDFGIYNFSEEDIKFILRENNIHKLDRFFEKKYDIFLSG